MKVFRKKLIPIIVHHRLFIGVVIERSYDVVFQPLIDELSLRDF